MVFANWNTKDRYTLLKPKFEKAFDFIESVLINGAELGRYEIDGDNMYAMVCEYDTKENDGKFEGHRKYIDIQFVLSGREIIDVANIDDCETAIEYDSEKDAEFFALQGPKSSVLAVAGDFVIFFPEDLHNPGIDAEKRHTIRKIVVKVAV